MPKNHSQFCKSNCIFPSQNQLHIPISKPNNELSNTDAADAHCPMAKVQGSDTQPRHLKQNFRFRSFSLVSDVRPILKDTVYWPITKYSNSRLFFWHDSATFQKIIYCFAAIWQHCEVQCHQISPIIWYLINQLATLENFQHFGNFEIFGVLQF